MGEFQNGLKSGHLNESLAQRPTSSLVEVVIRVECYIKDEESNAKKKAQDIKEHGPSVEGSQQSQKNNCTLPIMGKLRLSELERLWRALPPKHSLWIYVVGGSSLTRYPCASNSKSRRYATWAWKMV